jgi:hypothetical protein
MAAHHARPPQICTASSMMVCAASVAEHLGSSRLPRVTRLVFRILDPGTAVREQARLRPIAVAMSSELGLRHLEVGERLAEHFRSRARSSASRKAPSRKPQRCRRYGGPEDVEVAHRELEPPWPGSPTSNSSAVFQFDHCHGVRRDDLDALEASPPSRPPRTR